ncbi:hypothetical protein PC129_g14707 [Phytophthora cactorum]|uniref:Uncharacterized protein n=2 Tax=Phytophthora cactorum TaxID=29920 RepID=A0A8T1HR51_9STRA|nr:hypothetical protein PC111_g15278 [Phytophthora cactorum]KAG2919300.1 hypothetical protein PC117_g16844 [Phytophthora cactorum]KAG3147313.1 hypothetical protein C6341_g17804 [Phytophthora cactorum]KAG3169933.1 hypothetical protein PC128_g19031 [Phytophthora cactorum]KAG3214366.1 hypothetical protein PC129_g14707 [Phytophthora cactorum]
MDSGSDTVTTTEAVPASGLAHERSEEQKEETVAPDVRVLAQLVAKLTDKVESLERSLTSNRPSSKEVAWVCSRRSSTSWGHLTLGLACKRPVHTEVSVLEAKEEVHRLRDKQQNRYLHHNTARTGK